MLKEWEKSEKPSEEEIKARLPCRCKRKVSKAAAFDQREESTGSCCA